MPSGGFTRRAKVLSKNAWSGHYPKGSIVSKICSYFLEELFRVFFISNEWCVMSPLDFENYKKNAKILSILTIKLQS